MPTETTGAAGLGLLPLRRTEDRTLGNIGAISRPDGNPLHIVVVFFGNAGADGEPGPEVAGELVYGVTNRCTTRPCCGTKDVELWQRFEMFAPEIDITD